MRDPVPVSCHPTARLGWWFQEMVPPDGVDGHHAVRLAGVSMAVSLPPTEFTVLTDLPPAFPREERQLCWMESRGAKARAHIYPSRTVVLRGSTVVGIGRESKSSTDATRRIRALLVQRGALTPDGDLLRFPRDVEFTSSSQAASVIAGNPRSGPQTWRREDRKRRPNGPRPAPLRVHPHHTLDELRDARDAAKNAQHRRRIEIVMNAATGASIPEVMQATNASRETIRTLVDRYNADGPSALRRRPHTPRRERALQSHVDKLLASGVPVPVEEVAASAPTSLRIRRDIATLLQRLHDLGYTLLVSPPPSKDTTP